MAEDKTPEPVIENKENGIESKETDKDPKDDVAIEEKADTHNMEETEVDKDHAKGVGTVDENLNESENVEHKENLKKEKDEVKKKDVVLEEGKNSDTAKEKATETVEKESESEKANDVKGKEVESEKPDGVEVQQTESENPGDVEGKQDESEKPDDIDGKQDSVLDSNGKSTEVQEFEKDAVEEEPKKYGEEKNGTKKANAKPKDVQEPKTPAASSFSIDRPVRERKSVQRFVAIIEGDSSREFHIEKGNGTALKDIPNVAYKLSQWKSGDTLKLFHGILFSRRGKAADIKQHISKFSGFVWHGDEEKQKLKIKEKLEKHNKEKLLEFCDILDITIASKVTKDEVVTTLLEFLIAPHATTDKLLAAKEESSKGSKRKKTDKGTPGSGSAKSRKKKAETSRTDDKMNSAETEDETAEDTKENEAGASDEAVIIPETKESAEKFANKSSSEEKPSEPETQTDEDSKSKKRKRTPKRKTDSDVKSTKSASSAKKTTSGSTTEPSEGKRNRTPSLKNSTPSAKVTPRSSKKPKVDGDKVTSPKASTKKQKNEKPVKEINVAASKEKSGKGVVSKGKENEKTSEDITNERLREEACKILKEVDFNTATFTDIVKILAERFKTDLTPKKSVIKVMIQEELTKLANEEEDDDDGHGDVKTSTKDAAPNDETHHSTSQKV